FFKRLSVTQDENLAIPTQKVFFYFMFLKEETLDCLSSFIFCLQKQQTFYSQPSGNILLSK
ncbi:MAG: hypothetical protein IJ181_12210, partial [Acidaminococcaceae bacterium]|nr:hypothetical protein [Acidaminococcaceae bacterium]